MASSGRMRAPRIRDAARGKSRSRLSHPFGTAGGRTAKLVRTFPATTKATPSANGMGTSVGRPSGAETATVASAAGSTAARDGPSTATRTAPEGQRRSIAAASATVPRAKVARHRKRQDRTAAANAARVRPMTRTHGNRGAPGRLRSGENAVGGATTPGSDAGATSTSRSGTDMGAAVSGCPGPWRTRLAQRAGCGCATLHARARSANTSPRGRPVANASRRTSTPGRVPASSGTGHMWDRTLPTPFSRSSAATLLTSWRPADTGVEPEHVLSTTRATFEARGAPEARSATLMKPSPWAPSGPPRGGARTRPVGTCRGANNEPAFISDWGGSVTCVPTTINPGSGRCSASTSAASPASISSATRTDQPADAPSRLRAGAQLRVPGSRRNTSGGGSGAGASRIFPSVRPAASSQSHRASAVGSDAQAPASHRWSDGSFAKTGSAMTVAVSG